MNPFNIAFRDDREKFEYFFLSALLGLVFFNFFVLLNPSQMNPLNDTQVKPDFKLFILAWSACPALGFFSAYLIHRVKTRWFSGAAGFYPLFLLLNVLLFLVYLQPNWRARFYQGGWSFLLAFGLLQLVGLGLWTAIQNKEKTPSGSVEDPFHFYRGILVIFIGWVLSIHSLDHMLRDWRTLNYLFLVSVLCFFYFLVPFGKTGLSFPGAKWKIRSLIGYGLVFAAIAWLVIDPFFPFQPYHGSYYLGPLSDLMAGKSLLYNINAQYGVFVFYFLKFIFRFIPLGYTSFSWVQTMLIVVQYCLFYFIARRLFKSGLYSLLVLVALILLNHFGQTPRPGIAPSVGPLRFGFIYILMALVLVRNQRPMWRGWIFWLESLVLGMAFFWSYEVCFYTLPPYLAFAFFEAGFFEKGTGMDWGGLLKRLLKLGVCIGSLGIYLYLDVHARSGDWPHWSYYMDYIFLYKGGFGSMPRPGVDLWCLIAGTLYFSLFTILALSFKREGDKPLPENLNAMVLLTFYGIFQYLYFVYRSHPNNLYHISMPSLLLYAYWLYVFRSQDPSFLPREARKTVFAIAVVFVGIYLQALLPDAVIKIKEQYLPLPQWWQKVVEGARDIPRDDHFANEAGELFRKYSGDRNPIPYFFGIKGAGSDDYVDFGLDTVMATGRAKLFPYNDLSQASICPPVLARIKAFDPRLQKGDYVYYRLPTKEDLLNPFRENVGFEKDAFDGLFVRYKLKLIEEKYGINVYQVLGNR